MLKGLLVKSCLDKMLEVLRGVHASNALHDVSHLLVVMIMVVMVVMLMFKLDGSMLILIQLGMLVVVVMPLLFKLGSMAETFKALGLPWNLL